MTWTAEQVIALAPDPSAAKAGRELATERRWTNLGRSEAAPWGECKGSGAQPYQTQQPCRGYQAPALLLQKETARVLLEPVGRAAPGAEGVVDL